MSRRGLRVALVHEFLTQFGGAERVLAEFARMFPDARIYTLIHDPAKIGPDLFEPDRIVTSPLQGMPFARTRFKWYLPVMDWATERLVLPGDLDLVLSDASAFAKGVLAPPGVPHLCYLHTPTRYLWSVQDSYVRDAPIPAVVRPFVGPVLRRLKRWDYAAAQRPHAYIANSRNVAEQTKRYYDREPDAVIFPFVDTDRFSGTFTPKDYVFALSRIEPYKRLDLVADACLAAKLPLKVAGSGTRLAELRERYKRYPTIEFLGRVPDDALPKLYGEARVFVFSQEEDAGITPLEAMAAGRPVLAYGKGGALESVKSGVSGEFFDEQTPEALSAALMRYDWQRYRAAAIRAHVAAFDVARFRAKVETVIDDVFDTWRFQHLSDRTTSGAR